MIFTFRSGGWSACRRASSEPSALCLLACPRTGFPPSEESRRFCMHAGPSSLGASRERRSSTEEVQGREREVGREQRPKAELPQVRQCWRALCSRPLAASGGAVPVAAPVGRAASLHPPALSAPPADGCKQGPIIQATQMLELGETRSCRPERRLCPLSPSRGVIASGAP